jgi:hypothetical protein
MFGVHEYGTPGHGPGDRQTSAWWNSPKSLDIQTDHRSWSWPDGNWRQNLGHLPTPSPRCGRLATDGISVPAGANSAHRRHTALHSIAANDVRSYARSLLTSSMTRDWVGDLLSTGRGVWRLGATVGYIFAGNGQGHQVESHQYFAVTESLSMPSRYKDEEELLGKGAKAEQVGCGWTCLVLTD